MYLNKREEYGAKGEMYGFCLDGQRNSGNERGETHVDSILPLVVLFLPFLKIALHSGVEDGTSFARLYDWFRTSSRR